jgi:hypothetical protein
LETPSTKKSLPSPSRKELERCEAAAKSAERKVQQSPDKESVIAEFGRDCVTENPDGSWVARIRDREKMKKAVGMMSGVHREESERGREVQASQARERVVMEDDSIREVPEHLLDNMRRKFTKGMRPVGRNGKAAALHFSLTGATERYERGPDGLYFSWSDGWVPINLWRNGALSPQRDPEGNVWVEVDGEWILMDEVS